MRTMTAGRLVTALLASAFALAPLHVIRAQVTAPGSGSNATTAPKLAFENAQILVNVLRVIRLEDGAQVRVRLEIKDKTDVPLWVILMSPRATITDENGSVLLAKRLTGMMSCDDLPDDWKGATSLCVPFRKARYTRLEPGIAYPFTIQFVGGTDDDEDKAVQPGPLQLLMRFQILTTLGRPNPGDGDVLTDIAVRDLP